MSRKSGIVARSVVFKNFKPIKLKEVPVKVSQSTILIIPRRCLDGRLVLDIHMRAVISFSFDQWFHYWAGITLTRDQIFPQFSSPIVGALISVGGVMRGLHCVQWSRWGYGNDVFDKRETSQSFCIIMGGGEVIFFRILLSSWSNNVV